MFSALARHRNLILVKRDKRRNYPQEQTEISKLRRTKKYQRKSLSFHCNLRVVFSQAQYSDFKLILTKIVSSSSINCSVKVKISLSQTAYSERKVE